MFARPATPKKPNPLEIALARTPWLSAALVVGLGGAAYTIASVFALHYFLETFEDGSLIDPQARTSLFGITTIGIVLLFIVPFFKRVSSPNDASKVDMTGGLIILFVMSFITLGIPCPANTAAYIAAHGATSFTAYFLMYFFSKFPSIKLSILAIWWFAYFAIWLVGATTPISLPVFILIWSAIGFGGGMLIYTWTKTQYANERNSAYSFRRSAEETQTQAQGVAQTRRRASRTSGTVSRFGRIPQDTVDLLSNHIRRITGPITAALPIGSSVDRRNQTVLILLETVVSDWRENDNFDLMTSDDIDDFQSFIEAAAYLSDDEKNAISAAIYKTTLSALARDWLDNWNATDNSGPPDRLY